jgi:hypothetical protein
MNFNSSIIFKYPKLIDFKEIYQKLRAFSFFPPITLKKRSHILENFVFYLIKVLFHFELPIEQIVYKSD